MQLASASRFSLWRVALIWTSRIYFRNKSHHETSCGDGRLIYNGH